MVIRYKGRPKQVSNPDGSKDGWTKTGDGAVALGEPQQTPSWIPVNDHPTDKATWALRFVTPREMIAISNGELVSKERTDDSTITEWEQNEPMASYLALAAIGEFRFDQGEVDGLPYVGAVDRRIPKFVVDEIRERTETAHEFLSEVAGPYPFSCHRSRDRPVGPRLRDGDADPLLLPEPAAPPARDPRGGPPVVRQLGLGRALEGHLAERGLRHVHGVAL